MFPLPNLSSFKLFLKKRYTLLNCRTERKRFHQQLLYLNKLNFFNPFELSHRVTFPHSKLFLSFFELTPFVLIFLKKNFTLLIFTPFLLSHFTSPPFHFSPFCVHLLLLFPFLHPFPFTFLPLLSPFFLSTLFRFSSRFSPFTSSPFAFHPVYLFTLLPFPPVTSLPFHLSSLSHVPLSIASPFHCSLPPFHCSPSTFFPFSTLHVRLFFYLLLSFLPSPSLFTLTLVHTLFSSHLLLFSLSRSPF